MAAKKSIDAKEFYANTLDEYIAHLQAVKPEAKKPLIIKPNIKSEDALRRVEDIVKSNGKDEDDLNKKLLKLVAKKAVKPTVKQVYQTVLMTFFDTAQVEYDYSYTLNGDTINMSPRRISINEGHGEFSSATECFVGQTTRDCCVYPWEKVTDEDLLENLEPGYVIANIQKSDFDKDSKESMRQYNKQLNQWLEDYEQERQGVARRVNRIRVYDKDYSYNELILLAPFIYVTYDLGNMLVTFTVSAMSGTVKNVLLNNPAGRFPYRAETVPPSFNVVIFLLASFAMVVFGGLIYLAWYFSQKLTFHSKALNGYDLADLRKLL